MSQDAALQPVTISHSEIQGFVQQNYGTVTFVYNYPQGAQPGIESAVAGGELPICPYRGLLAFQPEDARFYFGREAAVDRVKRLVTRGSVTAVTGASGSGKSSLVFAGVVPSLAAAGEWLFATFRPGADPFYALAGALVPVLRSSGPDAQGAPESTAAQTEAIARLAAELRVGSGEKLRASLQEISRGSGGKRLLLIADQFEELYTLCEKPALRKQFLDHLLAAVQAEGAPCHLLLTVRADFLAALVGHQPLAAALQNQIDILAPMSRAELTTAVVKPAALMGVRYEDHLVDRILDDLGDDDGALPLLEFALAQLWEHQRADRTLTHTAYEEIGRVSGAVRQHAEAAYARLDAQEQQLTRRLIRRLVSLSGGDDPGDERATRRQVELQSLDEATQALAKGELAQRRLVVISHVTDRRAMVEIVHETLLANWPELAGWIREDRETILRVQQLALATAAYARAGQNPDLLYRGRQLREAAAWAGAHAGELSVPEQQFLEASRRHEQQKTLVHYSGYALTALLVLLAAAWVIWARPFGEAQVQVPMPAEDFNLAIADFTVEGLDEIEDAEIADTLRRDAEAVAGKFAELLLAQEADFESALGGDTGVNILTADRFDLAGTDAQSVEAKAKELRATVLVYGTLRLVNDRYWSIVPRLYIDHSATEDRAAEIMDEQGLFTPVSYIRGLTSSREMAVLQLAPSLEVLFALYQGLDYYDQGTVAGYQQAAKILCSTAETLNARNVKEADLLYLFCGHAYSGLLLLETSVQETKLEYQNRAIDAYETAVELNLRGLRARISLAALLISAFKPGFECDQGDLDRIAQASAVLEEAAMLIDDAATIRTGTYVGYLLNRGHASFWLSMCRNTALDPEDWQRTRNYYQQAIAASENASDGRHDMSDFDAADAHAQLAYTILTIEWYNAQGAGLSGESSDILFAEAADHFEQSLGLLLLHQTEPRSAYFARAISVDSIYTFCRSGQMQLAAKYLDSYASLPNGWPREEVVVGIELRDPQLRKECDL